jgi:NAD(P)-dependent dehydrogenase (short-subunit alcohol dehydrogenase family)
MPALHGSRSLVVGGAHRLGRAIALDLAEAGADVAISYHTSAHAAEATRAEIEALGVRTGAFAAEAGDPAQMAALIDTAVAELGGLEVVVYCPSAGFEPVRPEVVTEALWDLAHDSTAKGFMFAAQAAHRHMAASGGGVIVAITDVAGVQPWPLFTPHGAAKAAQIYMVKALALAWGRDGVRVCGFAPGPVLMPEGIAGNPDETALGRLGDPADVAHAVRYCIEAGFVTGQNIVVDGGRLLRP